MAGQAKSSLDLSSSALSNGRSTFLGDVQLRRPNTGDPLPEEVRYLCTFFFLCFSLPFFSKGVLVGVGDGVPENSGVGDGLTRG